MEMKIFVVKTIFFMLLLIGFTACKEKVSELEMARKEVMEIHDKSMAEIGNIIKYRTSLDTMRVQNPDSLKISELIVNLNEAEEEMMLWMANYKEPDQSELSAFYKDQKNKITLVAEKIFISINESKKYLNE